MSYTFKYVNDGQRKISISIEPWANVYELLPGESIIVRAYDYEMPTENSEWVIIRHSGEWITLFMLDDASIDIVINVTKVEGLSWS